MEIQLPPQLDDERLLEEFLRSDEEIAMEQQGFYFVTSSAISEHALLNGSSLEKDEVDHLATSGSMEVLASTNDQQRWQQLMEYELNVSRA